MTSEQAMRTTVLLLCAMVAGGCQTGPEPISAPYPTTHTWAVAPLRNESGSLAANGLSLADLLARRLESVPGLHVLAVNRTLQGMQALDLQQVTTPQQARSLLKVVGADGLVVGTITAYDPYDPPKLGLAIELFVDPRVERADAIDVRRLTRAATGQSSLPAGTRIRQPVSIISGFFDAADPDVNDQLKQYAILHRRVSEQSWRVYRISMDLYTEFVAYVVCNRLIQAETQRVGATEPPSP